MSVMDEATIAELPEGRRRLLSRLSESTTSSCESLCEAHLPRFLSVAQVAFAFSEGEGVQANFE